MRVLLKFCWLIACISSVSFSWGQDGIDTAESDTTKFIYIDRSDHYYYFEENDTIKQQLVGNVELHQDSLLIYCDSAIKVNEQVDAVGSIIVQQWDSISLFGDTLVYNGVDKKGIITGESEVVLQTNEIRLFTDKLFFDQGAEIVRYTTGADIYNDTTYLYSKRGTYVHDDRMLYFRDSVYIRGSNFKLFADTLAFHTESRIAYFIGPTRIVLRETDEIYCEDGYYDVRNDNAMFTQNAVFSNAESDATSDTMFYIGNENLVTLKDSARLMQDDQIAKANVINYYRNSEDLWLLGNARFEDSSSFIDADSILYNLNTESYETFGEVDIAQGPQQIKANNLYSDSLGFTYAEGMVSIIDTTNGTLLNTDSIKYNDSTGYMLAYGNRPLLTMRADADSIYVSSDTMLRLESNDSNSIISYYNNVRIYKTDLQAVCDSLVFDDFTNTFKLYQDPVIWASDSSQFFADSIIIQMDTSDRIDRIFLYYNAMIVQTEDYRTFNQMRGKTMEAIFKDGSLDKMLIRGNAESIYFALDDLGAYIGVNQCITSNMDIGFRENAIEEISFFRKPDCTFHAIQKININEFVFDNFRWLPERKPKSKDDVRFFMFADAGSKIKQPVDESKTERIIQKSRNPIKGQ